MSAALRRANRSLDEVRRLRARVDAWSRTRDAADRNNKHKTVLRLVTSEVDGSLSRLEPEYEAIARLERGEAYDRCRRLDAVLDPAELSARMAEHERVWVVLVPTGWSTFLDALSREPAASRLHRDPTTLVFNGGMQVVVLTRA